MVEVAYSRKDYDFEVLEFYVYLEARCVVQYVYMHLSWRALLVVLLDSISFLRASTLFWGFL